jgi:hypothetical protein
MSYVEHILKTSTPSIRSETNSQQPCLNLLNAVVLALRVLLLQHVGDPLEGDFVAGLPLQTDHEDLDRAAVLPVGALRGLALVLLFIYFFDGIRLECFFLFFV